MRSNAKQQTRLMVGLMQVHKDIKQGSQEWLNMRLGLITCSEIKTIRADGAGAQTYINGLAYERITGESSAVFSGNLWTDRGHELEPVAREAYERKTGFKVEQVSFIKNLGFGYSPDGLVGDNGLIEIKAKQPKDQITLLRSGNIPNEHLDQLDGGLLCSNREWIDFVAYCPNLPIFIKRVYAKDRTQQIEKLNELIAKYNVQIEDVANQISEMY